MSSVVHDMSIKSNHSTEGMAVVPGGHVPLGVHVAQVLKERSPTGSTHEFATINKKTDPLTTDRRVEKVVLPAAIANNLRVRAKTLLADLWRRCRLDFDLDVVSVFAVV